MKFREVRELVPAPNTESLLYVTFILTERMHLKTIANTYSIGSKDLTSIPTDNKIFVNDVKTNRFYEPILGKFQTAMEERALQLILKTIIGDDLFSGRQNLRHRAKPYNPLKLEASRTSL
jgi:hypothetical protein